MRSNFLMLSILPILTACLSSNTAFAQPDKEQAQEMMRKHRERMQNQMAINQMMNIARNEYTQRHLELVPEQLEDIAPILEKYQQFQQEMMRENMKRQKELREAAEAGDHKRLHELNMKMSERMFTETSEAMEKIEKILIPHQLKRIKQIAIQAQAVNRPDSYGGLGLPLAVADQLGLSKEEKEKLKEVTDEANQEFKEELAELRKKLMKKVLAKLPKKKQEEYKEIVGDHFDLDEARRSMHRGFQSHAQQQRTEANAGPKNPKEPQKKED